MPVQNNKWTLVITHDVANVTYVVAGNNTVSNLASGIENVASASILSAHYGSSNNSYWVLKRGANVAGVFVNSGSVNFADRDISLSKDSAANIVLELVGTGVGFIMLEVRKSGYFPSTS